MGEERVKEIRARVVPGKPCGGIDILTDAGPKTEGGRPGSRSRRASKNRDFPSNSQLPVDPGSPIQGPGWYEDEPVWCRPSRRAVSVAGGTSINHTLWVVSGGIPEVCIYIHTYTYLLLVAYTCAGSIGSMVAVSEYGLL